MRLLFVRSAMRVQGDFAALDSVASGERSAKLRATLQSKEPALTSESAELLFATFIALVSGLIGERLTTQLLRTAWPAVEATAPKDQNK